MWKRDLRSTKSKQSYSSSGLSSSIRDFFAPSVTKAQTRSKRNTSNSYSVLETRCLLAAVTFTDGEIVIAGTTGDDSATISLSGSNVLVLQPQGIPAQSFSAASVNSIRFIGLAGDDFFQNNTSISSFAFGQAGNDTLIGGFGNDTLAGNIGDDNLTGRGGDDRLVAGNGDDVVSGGAGIDTILGTAGLNTLRGDAGGDFIFGGNDVDMIFGGDGNDQLSGNGGGDTILGGDGSDSVNAGPGNDTIDGQGGNDFLYGQAGDDEVTGGIGNDVVGGNGGNDTLRGGTGDDFLSAGTGDDDLFGEAGNDRLFVIAGNNTLSGGSSSAAINPQANSFQDLAVFASNSQNFQVRSGQNNGIETVDFRDTTTADGAQVETLGDQNIISSDVENFFFTTVQTANNAINVVEEIIVRPIVVSNSDGTNTAEFIGDAESAADILVRIDRIFAQAGVDVTFETTREVNNTFFNVGTGGGARPANDLFSIIDQGDSAGLGSSDPNVVDAYFVERVPSFPTLSNDQAVGLAIDGQSGVALSIGDNLVGFEAGRIGVARLIAHEIAHNLGLAHVGGNNNLLTVPASADLLTTSQQTAILASSLTRPTTLGTLVEVDLNNAGNVPGTATLSNDYPESSIGGCGGCGFCVACTSGLTLS